MVVPGAVRLRVRVLTIVTGANGDDDESDLVLLLDFDSVDDSKFMAALPNHSCPCRKVVFVIIQLSRYSTTARWVLLCVAFYAPVLRILMLNASGAIQNQLMSLSTSTGMESD